MTDTADTDRSTTGDTGAGGAPIQLQPPAKRPCPTCPYRQDVPSGIWAASEYERLPRYDAETPYQPPGVFQCHLTDGTLYRICAGWAGCHGHRPGHELLSLRLATRAIHGAPLITEQTAEATADYVSPVPLFTSGAEAAAHGLRDLLNPSTDASDAIDKILRVRSDITVPGRRPQPRTSRKRRTP